MLRLGAKRAVSAPGVPWWKRRKQERPVQSACPTLEFIIWKNWKNISKVVEGVGSKLASTNSILGSGVPIW